VATGKRVLVPFGRRRETGYVFGQSQGFDIKEIKSILDILDEQPLFPSSMVPFFRWISDYYKYPVGQVVKNALPGGLKVRDCALVAINEK
jgi:primosomal protein N' (replication factor Y)